MGHRRQVDIIKAQATVTTVGNQRQVDIVRVAKAQTTVMAELGTKSR